MTEPLDKLVAIDPNNVDAWSMYAFGAQGRMQAATVAAEKKKWTDSLIYYAGKADSLLGEGHGGRVRAPRDGRVVLGGRSKATPTSRRPTR